MNSSPNRASGPAGKSRRKEVSFDLTTARAMLPLVTRIVTDLHAVRQQITRLTPEQDRLDRHRHDLSWPERQRRYSVHEEMAAAATRLHETLGELKQLGIAELPHENEPAEIGFPTQLNGRSAFYLWRTGEADVVHWNYTGESVRRGIPPEWVNGTGDRPRRR